MTRYIIACKIKIFPLPAFYYSKIHPHLESNPLPSLLHEIIMIHAAIFMNKQSVPAPLLCVFFALSLLLSPFPCQEKQTTLFFLLIITFFPWDPTSTSKGQAFGSKVMSAHEIFLTLSLLVMGGMLERRRWCCASAAQQLPKHWCVINTFPATSVQHCESCSEGNTLRLRQTLNMQKYSGCLLTTLTG